MTKHLRAEEPIKPGQEIATNTSTTDKELDKLWLEHIKEYINKGITITFKPVRFFTSKERTEMDRYLYPSQIPTYKDNNSKPLDIP